MPHLCGVSILSSIVPAFDWMLRYIDMITGGVQDDDCINLRASRLSPCPGAYWNYNFFDKSTEYGWHQESCAQTGTRCDVAFRLTAQTSRNCTQCRLESKGAFVPNKFLSL